MQFSAYLGAGFEAFRVSDSFGEQRARPELDRAILDYLNSASDQASRGILGRK